MIWHVNELWSVEAIGTENVHYNTPCWYALQLMGPTEVMTRTFQRTYVGWNTKLCLRPTKERQRRWYVTTMTIRFCVVTRREQTLETRLVSSSPPIGEHPFDSADSYHLYIFTWIMFQDMCHHSWCERYLNKQEPTSILDFWTLSVYSFHDLLVVGT